MDLEDFNKNIIDPIKFTFDKIVYRKTLEEIIDFEILRQRDKTNTNAIGYFHQHIFKYIKCCYVPDKGFDVIYKNENREIYVEMKNKHNTMNSSSSKSTYIKLQNQALNNNKCECFLVEVIAKKSQNICWETTIKERKCSNERIRRVSIDKFYEIVTGNKDSFMLLCKQLPITLEKLISNNQINLHPTDTVISELKSKNPDLLKSLYLLAFRGYIDFNKF